MLSNTQFTQYTSNSPSGAALDAVPYVTNTRYGTVVSSVPEVVALGCDSTVTIAFNGTLGFADAEGNDTFYVTLAFYNVNVSSAVSTVSYPPIRATVSAAVTSAPVTVLQTANLPRGTYAVNVYVAAKEGASGTSYPVYVDGTLSVTTVKRYA